MSFKTLKMIKGLFVNKIYQKQYA